MWLIVGLGNPGPRYSNNRHNIGFMLLDALHEHLKAKPWRAKFQSDFSETELNGEKVFLIKPQTFMNESGRAVAEVMRFYKIPLDHVVVAHDELDLAPAKLRIKVGGSDAGHNGLGSITEHCGANYKRLRMGIGHPGRKSQVHSYVLGDFTKQDEAWLYCMNATLAEHCDLLLKNQDAELMNKVSLATKDKLPKGEE